MSITEKASNMEDKKLFTNLRTSLCESFISILNGIKSPSDDNQVRVPENEVRNHMRNMFYYIEGLMADTEMEVDPNFAEKVIDLYCDIKMLSGNVDAITDPKEKQEAFEFAMLM